MFVALAETFGIDGGYGLELVEQRILGQHGRKSSVGEAPLDVIRERRIAELKTDHERVIFPSLSSLDE